MGFEALADVINHCQEGLFLQREGTLAVHPVRGDADRNRCGHQDLGIQQQRRLLRHQGDAGGVVDHGQVLVVLLGRAGRDDHGFQEAAFEGLAELFPGALPEQDLAGVHVGLAGAFDLGSWELRGEGGGKQGATGHARNDSTADTGRNACTTKNSFLCGSRRSCGSGGWGGQSCLDSAGINRHGVANERVVQGRCSEPP